MNFVLQKHSLNYIQYYCRSLVPRLLRTPVKLRSGMKVTHVINRCVVYANVLVPRKVFAPAKQFNIVIAKAIDNNFF